MSGRPVASSGVMALLAVMSLTPASVAGQASPARPDLQGVWISNGATPLERPQALDGKSRRTDEEVAELKRRADHLFKIDNGDFPGGDSLFLAALANLDHYKSPNATAGSVETIEREFDNRTSLIVDPADGKVPPLTPEGAKRQATFAASRLRAEPAGPEDV